MTTDETLEPIEAPSRGNWVKWNTFGDSFRGVYRGLRETEYEGKPLYHAVMVDDQGIEYRVNTPADLKMQLAGIEPGAKLVIEYTHTVKGKYPQPVKKFKVWRVVPGAPVLSPQPAPPSVGPSPPPQAYAAAPMPVTDTPPQAAGTDSYRQICALLHFIQPTTAQQIITALETLHPNEIEREAKLKEMLTAAGYTC